MSVELQMSKTMGTGAPVRALAAGVSRSYHFSSSGEVTNERNYASVSPVCLHGVGVTTRHPLVPRLIRTGAKHCSPRMPKCRDPFLPNAKPKC